MKKLIILLPVFLVVAACSQPVITTGPLAGAPLIARGSDSAFHNVDRLDGKKFAIAITPDGCMAWIGDNGAEGFADARLDPVTGVVVCTNYIPPGAVIGDYRQTDLFDTLP